MSSLYAKLIFSFTLLFLALSMAARALGSTQPPNPALEGFTVGCEGKPQPCWYGIVPGVTTVENAQAILNQRGYIVLEVEDWNSDPIRLWEANSPTDASCTILMKTWPINTNPDDPNERTQVLYAFSLLDCKHLYLGDVYQAIPNPIVKYSSSCHPQIVFEGIPWLNQMKPSSTSLTLPYDPVIDISFGDWEHGMRGGIQFDHNWYGFMPEWKLRRILYNKYCIHG